jgi:quinoprotein glucose dehydrogenase
VVIGILGLATAGGGAWLASLGGSGFYLPLGLAMLVTAALLFRRSAKALWVYGGVVLATLAWAVWEIGFDWWPMASRGDVVAPIGLWLLMPWITRTLPGGTPVAWRSAALPLAGALVIAAAVGGYALTQDLHDQPGALPGPRAAVAANYGGAADDDWPGWGRSSRGDHWSPLAEITPANVSRLQVAWTFRTGDIRSDNADPTETTYEVTPIKVGDTLYLCTPHDELIALDAETGRPRWRYDPHIVEYAKALQHLTCRGVAYHASYPGEPAAPNGGECPQRLFLPTADARLIAVGARTGQLCPGFGQGGAIDLWAGMPLVKHGFYYSTSPPVVTRDLVIVGGEVTDNHSTDEPSGVIRAYDVQTGRLVWNWDPDNPDATAPLAPGQTYVKNSPNSWGINSADEALGLVYVGIGNETPDEWAGHRNTAGERFNSAVVALEIATGKVRWVFQSVHHDLWDMDIGAQPSLVDLTTPHGVVPALVVPSKRGDLYVLDRRTGAPLFPVAERAVPQGAASGDHTSPTQPFSSVTLQPQPLSERDMWGATLFDQLWCRIQFKSLRWQGIFTPPSTQGSLVYPGNFGVFDWGGIAVDPAREIAFTNPDHFAFVSRLIPRATAAPDLNGGQQDGTAETAPNPMLGTPFAVHLEAFRSPLGLPCQAPPWGLVAGVDLVTGKVIWQHVNGTIRDNAPLPVPIRMGVPSLGGPLITAGGVGFLTSTLDYYIRAYDITTGRQLWEARLPAGGQSNPMTYRSAASGRQFIVTVDGGHGTLPTKAGDYVIAYALPVAS